MIQSLSSRFQRHCAFIILFVLLAQTVLAERAYIFEGSARSFKGYTVLPTRWSVSPTVSRLPILSNHVTSSLSLDEAVPKKKSAEKITTHVTVLLPDPQPEKQTDIGGPGQPEMMAFKAVGADNMVDLFSGDFSYNIPLGDVGGYPLNIFYSSGISMEQEASWVGLGWNINPGTIMRNMRGVPDDFNGKDQVVKEMNIKPNITVGVTGKKIKEVYGMPNKKAGFLNNATLGLFYNNYRGVGLEFGKSLVLNLKSSNSDSKTVFGDQYVSENSSGLSAGVSFNINSQSGLSINPSLGISITEYDKSVKYGSSGSLSASFNSRVGLQSIGLSGESNKTRIATECSNSGGYNYIKSGTSGFSSSLGFGLTSVTPSIQMPLTHRNYSLGIAIGKENNFGLYNGAAFTGYYSEASIRKEDKIQQKPAFGYLYYQDANNNKEALLDFNRLNDGVYTKYNPVIAMPNYTYDVFSISGQGIGGGFRAYRGDVGSVHDNYTKTRENAASINAEIGGGSLVEVGVNLNYVHTPTTAGEWRTGNLAREELIFTRSSGTQQAAYFKNPAEATRVNEAFMTNLGNEDLIRIKLDDPGTGRPLASPVWERFSNSTTRNGTLAFSDGKTRKGDTRDKRTQVINYLTSKEASYAGLDKRIKFYPLNVFPKGYCQNDGAIEIRRYIDGLTSTGSFAETVRKPHHISEITVTQTDGKRYVYGIPVYNVKENEVSFSASNFGKSGNEANTPDAPKQLVSFNEQDLTDNKRGKDWFYQKDAVDPYAHSFLLTGLLSPDYVDITGDGITDDDMGTSVKFNYSKLEGNFGWRAPYVGTATASSGYAAYNKGLKTDNSDDRAHFTYGEKELWYLNSIESKNMIATFTTADREDGRAAANQFGGRSVSGMRKLQRIDIYTKAEWMKEGVKKPVKTIHFEYHTGANELCHGTPDNSVTGGGKLTLRRIWFTYNGNDKLKKNYYSFKYHSNNPDYNRTSNDRWGSYKPASANESALSYQHFGALDNADFPFSDQDKTSADNNAAAWTLQEITLPSGAKIKVDFEADDYAYVQNRRAAQMFRIAGFGKSPGSVPSDQLYADGIDKTDHFYIFVDAPATSKNDVKLKYIDGLSQLFMKLWIRMPKDQYRPDDELSEAIPIYAKVEDYGWVNGNRFWIKVKEGKGRFSPMFYTAMQFMIKNLPSKLYVGSDVKGNGPIGLLKALAGMLVTVLQFTKGLYSTSKLRGICKTVDREKSYIRLHQPGFKKLGGGLRVKRVTIKDSWKEMTSTSPGADNGMQESTYGQDYEYTTSTMVNGVETLISSGVAAYEPAVGAEENPFREIMHYDDRLHPLGPNERGAVELPLGEVFFPSPSVGYSKVTVKSIHRDNVKSGVGKTVTEFYTTRDFPTKSDFTSFDPSSHVRFKSNPILRLLKLDVREAITLSQGFRVQTNDMNGKIHKQISYDEKGIQVTYTENFYRLTQTGEQEYSFNNTVPMLEKPGAPVVNAVMGKEVEVMTDFREHVTRAVTFNLDFNLNVNQAGGFPVPVFSIIPPVHFAETGYRSAAVLKIVNSFGILEKVKQIDKGSEVNARDLLYDAETGQVLLTESNNEFNKPVYNFSYPAHWAYTGMQGAYKNIDAVYEHLRFQHGKLTTPDFDMNVFESGDEIYIDQYSNRGAMNEPGCYPSGLIQYIDIPVDPDNPSLYVRKIWALDMRKDPDNPDRKFLFIDQNGDPYSGSDVRIKIIRSGKRNLVNAMAGGFTSLVNPLRETSPGILTVQEDDNTQIINTAANSYSERWRVDDAFYTMTEEQTVVRKTLIQNSTVKTSKTHSYGVYHPDGAGPDDYHDFMPNTDHLLAEWLDIKKKRKAFGAGKQFKQRSWMLFDFSGFTANDIVLSAKIQLHAHSVASHNFIVHKNEPAEFPQCPPDAAIYNNIDFHSAGNPHTSQPNLVNNFWLSRFKSAWPGDNACANWYELYNFMPENNDRYRKFVVSQAPYGNSAANYPADISLLVTEMLKDKFDPLKNYATALKLSLVDDELPNRQLPARVCFWGHGSGTLPNPLAPTILVKHHSTSLTDPIVYTGPAIGAPINPPDGYIYWSTSEKVTQCYSHFTRKRMNPYTKGVLGNWRADQAYVYYANRREASAGSPTAALNKGGVIAANYKQFWVTPANADLMEVNPAAITNSGTEPAPWKWNSRVTQFNNRGFELENTDPLGRFNCGLYGYDKTMPVAVANNAKLRSTAFDGFEDYYYQGSECVAFCKPNRHFVINNVVTHLDDQVSHSGIYSLKLAAGESLSAHASIVAPGADAAVYGVNIENITTSLTGTYVDPRGNGILGRYFNKPFSMPLFVPTAIETHLNDLTGTPYERDDYKIDLYRPNETSNYVSGAPPEEITPPFYARWDGWIQAPLGGATAGSPGVYTLYFSSDDGMKVWIDGTQVTDNSFFSSHSPATATVTVSWALGSIHSIRIYYFDRGGGATARLAWKRPDGVEEIVPGDFLYKQAADAAGSVQTDIFYCVKPDKIQVQGNALTDVFSPLQGQKMVFSAWVKEDLEDCHCTNYTSNQAEIYFDNQTSASASFTPTGTIIEGWQRYEGVFSIPAGATSMEVKLRSTGSKTIYWDDLRIHPFNANMKSFVYHPQTLRLTAEQDENNYCSFYEYDDDGTLIRVKKETAAGIKTITETRSALQKRITE